MNIIYWNVTTSIINVDWTYKINVESNISDIEYRDCIYVQQPWINTLPKVWDTVLLVVIKKGEYAILWIVSYSATQHLEINAADIKLVGTTITANWEDLTVDNT